MTQLVLLVVAAAWAAVLLPPMLRSRVDNRPNSSVTDFRRQLNKLQSTATPARGSMRMVGRPLAQTPPLRSGLAMRGERTHRDHVGGEHRERGGSTITLDPVRERRDTSPYGEPRRLRAHGDPSGGSLRPAMRDASGPVRRDHRDRDVTNGRRRPVDPSGQLRRHRDPSGAMRRPDPAFDARSLAKRRRSNVLFVLLLATACTLFLAASTGSTVMLYTFALSFLGLCGYVYLLAQSRQRGMAYDGWFESY